jgi:hypothetical protein
MAKKKLSHIKPYGLRMQPDMRRMLEDAADGKEQSLNSEIVERLEASFVARLDLSDFSDGELIDELIKRWGRDKVLIRLGRKSADE